MNPDRTGPIKFANIAKDEVLAPQSGNSIYLYSADVGNSSGAAAAVGIGYKLLDGNWKAGQWDDSEAASYLDDTTDAQDVGTDDFTLFNLTNNDGFVVQSHVKFDIVGITISTAASGGAPVYEYNYWNGSAWTALTLLNTPSYAAASDTYITFLKPHNWARLLSTDTPVATDGLTTGMYAIRVRSTTASGTTGGTASLLWVVNLIDYLESVSDGNSATMPVNPHGKILIPQGSVLIPYCSTANAANWANLEYSQGG